MRSITVYMSDGDTITTTINGTDDEIARHYLGHRFEAGCDTKHHIALMIHFLDTDRKLGLRVRNIESGSSGCIAEVRVETVHIDDTESYREVELTTRAGIVYALNDVWVYDLDGQWIPTIGYRHATT